MGISVVDAYNRTGLTVTPENDILMSSLVDATLAVLENYLDRKLTYDVQTETFLYTHGCKFQVDRYPIEHVTHVSMNAKHEVHHLTGTVIFWHDVVGTNLSVTYSGGYRVLPADLELAYWLTFDNLYSQASGGTSGAGSGFGGGEVSSISVPDVGTVRFSTSSVTTDIGSDGTGIASLVIPAVGIAILQPYRRMKA